MNRRPVSRCITGWKEWVGAVETTIESSSLGASGHRGNVSCYRSKHALLCKLFKWKFNFLSKTSTHTLPCQGCISQGWKTLKTWCTRKIKSLITPYTSPFFQIYVACCKTDHWLDSSRLMTWPDEGWQGGRGWNRTGKLVLYVSQIKWKQSLLVDKHVNHFTGHHFSCIPTWNAVPMQIFLEAKRTLSCDLKLCYQGYMFTLTSSETTIRPCK